MCATSISSTFPVVNEVLIVYTQETISLTCSHDNSNSGVTRWMFSPPIDCTSLIDHTNPSTTSPCGPFVFHNISVAAPNMLLSSTAVATASVAMTGTMVACRNANGQHFETSGYLTLCVTGTVFSRIVVITSSISTIMLTQLSNDA